MSNSILEMNEILISIADRVRPTIDRRLVHKELDDNVMVTSLRRVDPDRFEGDIHVHRAHAFFFEHPREHVPGLYLVEAVRQMTMAAAHLYLGVPMEMEFVLGNLHVDFLSLANINEPIVSHMTVSDITRRHGQLASFHAEHRLRQGSTEIATITGAITLMDKKVLQRMERKRGA